MVVFADKNIYHNMEKKSITNSLLAKQVIKTQNHSFGQQKIVNY